MDGPEETKVEYIMKMAKETRKRKLNVKCAINPLIFAS